ncbi:helix-turn-helix domain-containing protein [Portibacter lacus]|uniref:HTH araC/xylS-type domain-containing protein n=1 Tax=Portibacter lacus TaxID=1099794 RepID=A0AA37SSG7_9BACT|nr:helix-turn-helix domain-containing protein [Portibacter lacus]GLR17225.1 hypothetical protein GCM10007940_18400 [Portibacter lacus]
MFEIQVNVSNLTILASVFIGLTFAMLLIFAKRINQKANRLLGFLMLIIVLWNIWVLIVDFKLYNHFPMLCLIPLNLSLAIGPLFYLYTRKLIHPAYPFSKKTFLHFAPLTLEIIVHFLIANESLRLGINPTNTSSFLNFIPIIQLFTIISIITYCVLALKAIRKHHALSKDVFSNEKQYDLRWLYRLIIIFGILWFALVPYTFIDYIFYDFQLSIGDYYPIYILLSVITIWISAEAFLKPEVIFAETKDISPIASEENEEDLSEEAAWLEQEMERNQYFLDPDMTLRKLASELDLHPNHLSMLINSGLGKNFTDFVNQYRVDAVISRLHDPKFEHITLLGISFGCGFSSKTTFNRVFKNMTGKTPMQFKNESSSV